jgi:hypothetical protein
LQLFQVAVESLGAQRLDVRPGCCFPCTPQLLAACAWAQSQFWDDCV